MRSPVLVHLVIPAFNSSRTIGRTIRSLDVISGGNRDRVKIWVIDDGSDDGTASIAETLLKQGAWPHSEVRTKPNGGSGSARNEALRSFSEGWVLHVDADDELAADPVSLVTSSRGEATAIWCSAAICRKGVNIGLSRPGTLDPSRLQEQLSSGNPFAGPGAGLLYRRELVAELFDESTRYLEDWLYWALNPGLFARCVNRPEVVLGRIHVGPGNKSSHQHRNGEYRVRVANLLSARWAHTASETTKNNLALQKAIGAIQMGERGNWRRLATWPTTPTLYAKWIVYQFAYHAYLRLYPYA